MSANLPAARERDGDPCQVGEISAAWRVAPDALLLLGWQRDRPAPEGTVALQRASEQPGRFTRLSWPGRVAGTEAYGFVAAVHLPGAEVQGGDTLLLTGRRASDDGVLARLPQRFLEPALFGAELARVGAGAALLTARFLTGVFAAAPAAGNPAVRAMLVSFLDRAAEPDGCVEVVGAVRDRCAFLQGWGRPGEEECEVILAGSAVQRHKARAASFARADISGPALGQVLVLPPEAAQTGEVEAVFVLERDGIRRRPILAGRRALSEQETLGHIRAALPALRCNAATRAALTAALRPRYEGRFTLHDGGHPVRLGADLAAAAPGAGIYLTGWLYDPARVVEAVHLRGTRGTAARLDEAWTRIPRDDVTAAFRNEPGLPPGATGRHDHGFAAHAASLGGTAALAEWGEAFYLDVAFRDGGCGFVPLALQPAVDEAGQAALLASVDLHKPSGLAVIERQLAPFLARAAQPVAPAPAQPLTPASAQSNAQAAPNAWSSAVVVPLPRAELPRALLSQFLRDPLLAHEGVLFACGSDWTDASVAALGTLAGFYGVRASVLRVGGTATALSALDAALDHSGAERFLLLSPGTSGRTPGWRRALEAAQRAQGGAACVSPTVLYEDDSIRYAGLDGVEALDAEPYVRVRRRLAGLPAGFAAAGMAVPTAGPSVACCLIPRQVLASSKGRSSLGVAPDHEIELFLRLRAAGGRCAWIPTVRVHATEDPPAAPDAQERVGRLVSRWCLRARLAAEE